MMSAPSGADVATPSRLSSLQTIARARRGELPVRLILSLFGAVAAILLGAPLPAAAAWLLVTIATQAACLVAFGRFEKEDDLRPPSRSELMACHTTLFVACLWYSGLAAPLWFEGGHAGKIFALLLVCGALVHVMLHMPHDRRMLATALVGHAMVLVGLPAAALIFGGDLGRLGAAVALLGSVLFIAHLVVAFRKNGVVSAMLRAARERALAGQAAAEAASESKSRLLAMMSHELRAPVSGALGLTRRLLDSRLSPRQRQQTEALEDAGRMVLSLLDDLLDFSSVEARSLALKEGDVEVRRLVASLVTLWRPRAEEKGLRLEAVVEADAPVAVRTDGMRLRRIVSNLLSNAVKFTQDGEVRLHVGATPVDDGRTARLWVAVIDTGCGIALERPDQLFEALAQEGAGVGLAVSRQLTRLLGGALTVTSEVGVGSRFGFEALLPVVRWPTRPRMMIAFDGPGGAEATIGPEACDLELEDVTGADPHAGGRDPSAGRERARPALPGSAPVGRPLRICVVEDRPLNQRVTEAALQRLDCDLTFAADGRDALETLSAGRFDLIFMDLQLPVLDGFEVTRKVRAGGGRNARTPIIGLTANVLPGVRERCLSAGMDDFIGKPVELDELYELVERTLAGRGQAHGRA